jgi:hypothetical protein
MHSPANRGENHARLPRAGAAIYSTPHGGCSCALQVRNNPTRRGSEREGDFAGFPRAAECIFIACSCSNSSLLPFTPTSPVPRGWELHLHGWRLSPAVLPARCTLTLHCGPAMPVCCAGGSKMSQASEFFFYTDHMIRNDGRRERPGPGPWQWQWWP